MSGRQSRPVLRARRSIPRAEQAVPSSSNQTSSRIGSVGSSQMQLGSSQMQLANSPATSSGVTEVITSADMAQITTRSDITVNQNTGVDLNRPLPPQRPIAKARRRISDSKKTNNSSEVLDSQKESNTTPIPQTETASTSRVEQTTDSTTAPHPEETSINCTVVNKDNKLDLAELSGSKDAAAESSDKKEVSTEENKDGTSEMEEIIFQRVLRQKMVCDICLTHMKLFRCRKCFYSMCADCSEKIVKTSRDPQNVACPHCREKQQRFLQIRLPKF